MDTAEIAHKGSKLASRRHRAWRIGVAHLALSLAALTMLLPFL